MAKCVWPFEFAAPRNCSLLSRSGNAVQKISEWAPKQTELPSVLPFHGQHAFALGTVIALGRAAPGANLPGLILAGGGPSRLVATASAHGVGRALHTVCTSLCCCGGAG
jgi:hypothetical protein